MSFIGIIIGIIIGMTLVRQIGNSLKNHEEYLMYLYIQNMHQSKNQIIYIPTEGGLPVLEAGRFKKGGK